MRTKTLVWSFIALVGLGLFVMGCVPLTPGEAKETAAEDTKAAEEVEAPATSKSGPELESCTIDCFRLDAENVLVEIAAI